MAFYSKFKCPLCGSKAHIHERFLDNPDLVTEFRAFQVQCFVGCGMRGPEYRWALNMSTYVPKRLYADSIEQARTKAMQAWNELCKAVMKGRDHAQPKKSV